MKYLLSIIFFCAAFSATAQITVQARNGKAAIVTRDSQPNGEVIEIVQWKNNPGKALQSELDKVKKDLDQSETAVLKSKESISKEQAKQRALKQRATELQKGIDTLLSGVIIESGIPDKETTQPKTTTEKSKKKATKKPKKE